MSDLESIKRDFYSFKDILKKKLASHDYCMVESNQHLKCCELLDLEITLDSIDSGYWTVIAFNSVKNKTVNDLSVPKSVGWCIEMLNLSCRILFELIIDTPESLKNNRKPYYMSCNYDKSITANDSMFLENLGFVAIGEFMDSNDEIYYEVNKLLQNSLLDAVTIYSMELSKNIDFDMKKWILSGKSISSSLFLYAPIAVGLLLSNKVTIEDINAIRDSFLEVGLVLQAYNDWDVTFNMKSNHYVKRGLPTWFTVKLLEIGTDEQKANLRKCGENASSEDAARILEYFKKLNLVTLLKEECNKCLNKFVERSKSFPESITKTLIEQITQFLQGKIDVMK